jgi:hypothetical protein
MVAVEGGWLLVTVTEEADVQALGPVPFVTVHVKVAEVPTGTPVTVEAADVDVVMVAVPLVTDQTPVPTEGAVAAMLKVVVLQSV